MAYNPNVPAHTNRVQDDIAAMRDNFQHLSPLAQAVGELQAVSGLAPVVEELQAVSGLAQITDDLQAVSELAQSVDELQAVSELAPYVQTLVDSRIVEMGSNANGEYVRWDNGLQVCWHKVNVGQFSGAQNETKSFTWTYPATFSDLALVLASLSYPGSDSSGISRFLIGLIDTSPTNEASVKGYMRDLGGPSTTPWASLIAIGRWK